VSKLDLRLLAKQTSSVMVQEIESLATELNEPIKHLQVKTLAEWVTVNFVLCDMGFTYQFNTSTQEYTEWDFPLESMKYFKKLGLLD